MQHPHSFGGQFFPSILLVFLWTIFTKIVLHVQTYFHIAYIISCFHMVLFLGSYGRVRMCTLCSVTQIKSLFAITQTVLIRTILKDKNSYKPKRQIMLQQVIKLLHVTVMGVNTLTQHSQTHVYMTA